MKWACARLNDLIAALDRVENRLGEVEKKIEKIESRLGVEGSWRRGLAPDVVKW